MKRLLLVALLTLSTLGFGQSGVGMGLNYGIKAKSFAVEVSYSKDKRMAFGFGISSSFNSPSHIGTDIDNVVFYPLTNISVFRIETGKTFSFYGLCGYEYRKLKLVGKIGFGNYETVETYRSEYPWPNQHYYTYSNKVVDNRSETIMGAVVSYKFQKKWYLDLGYDNFNGTTIGLTCTL